MSDCLMEFRENIDAVPTPDPQQSVVLTAEVSPETHQPVPVFMGFSPAKVKQAAVMAPPVASCAVPTTENHNVAAACVYMGLFMLSRAVAGQPQQATYPMPWWVDDDDGVLLEDQLDAFDFLPPQSVQGQAAIARSGEDGWALQPLAHIDKLTICDKDGRDDPSGWDLRCPKNSEPTVHCRLHRNGSSNILVHEMSNVMVLTVARLRCSTHGSDFLITNEAVFKQLLEKGIRTMPQMVILSMRSVITRRAYEYGPHALTSPVLLHALP